ncbi:hypothetical protein WR25_22421 [Diploscapter pachys]|uniref:EGF-like domain-containing protein n=1 Tax=Diploscapter pachys TaxID=2018661 RepID=A0A2A2LU49_9BILA|nr:hypothetical protein WR25_22421 [Diploscapter pachys]
MILNLRFQNFMIIPVIRFSRIKFMHRFSNKMMLNNKNRRQMDYYSVYLSILLILAYSSQIESCLPSFFRSEKPEAGEALKGSIEIETNEIIEDTPYELPATSKSTPDDNFDEFNRIQSNEILDKTAKDDSHQGMLSDEEEYYVDEKELEKVTKSSINPVLLAKRKRIEASRCRDYCYNNGRCEVIWHTSTGTTNYDVACKCPDGYLGMQCEHNFNPLVVYASRVNDSSATKVEHHFLMNPFSLLTFYKHDPS